MNSRTIWIDQLRGFCMIAILWFHTEMYYAGHDVTPYAFYVGNVLAVFFFLSGYLFYTEKTIDLKHKLHGIFRYLVIPYFVFTSIISLPKAFVHHASVAPLSIVQTILNGHASWFIAALILSQLMFSLVLYVAKGKQNVLAVVALGMLVASYFVGNSYNPSVLYYEQNLWHFNESLLGFFLLSLGYFYHCYEKHFQWCQKEAYLAVLSMLFIASKCIVYQQQMQLTLGPLIVSHYAYFIVDMLIAILLLINIFKQVPFCPPLAWTGRHSLVYYFICGGIPFLTSAFLNKAGIPYGGYPTLLLAFLMVYAFSTLVVWLIYRYTNIV